MKENKITHFDNSGIHVRKPGTCDLTITKLTGTHTIPETTPLQK